MTLAIMEIQPQNGDIIAQLNLKLNNLIDEVKVLLCHTFSNANSLNWTSSCNDVSEHQQCKSESFHVLVVDSLVMEFRQHTYSSAACCSAASLGLPFSRENQCKVRVRVLSTYGSFQ